MPENQAVLFVGLILGVLRILLFQGRAESPKERVAQGKRSGTLGWVIVGKTIYALKGQKRGYCAFVSHTQCFYVFTLLPFQGVDIIFLFHIPRATLRLPWARRYFGLSARLCQVRKQPVLVKCQCPIDTRIMVRGTFHGLLESTFRQRH